MRAILWLMSSCPMMCQGVALSIATHRVILPNWGVRRTPVCGWKAAPLPRLVGVAAKADYQLAGAPVNGDALFGVGQHVSELVSAASVTNAEVVCEAERPALTPAPCRVFR